MSVVAGWLADGMAVLVGPYVAAVCLSVESTPLAINDDELQRFYTSRLLGNWRLCLISNFFASSVVLYAEVVLM